MGLHDPSQTMSQRIPTFPSVWQAPPKTGWICGKCGRSYGPVAVECFHCNAKITMAEMGTPSAP